MNDKFRAGVSLVAISASVALSGNAMALSNAAQVPVFVYHSSAVKAPCDYNNYASVTLEADLENFHARGITVIPLYWLAEWARGYRDGSTLPDKVVAITADDGMDLDWYTLYLPNNDCGPLRKSFKTVIQEFKARHPEYPFYSPHVSSFVIASPVARSWLSPDGPTGSQYFTDAWWGEAQASGFMEIYNHGSDHDTGALTFQQFDSALQIYVPIGGYVNGAWQGEDTFNRISNYTVSNYEVTKAATFITTKIGQWPDLFAYPFGNATPALQTYFANYQGEHQTLAAFTSVPQYVSRSSSPYLMPRFVSGDAWTTPGGMDAILVGAGL